MDRSEPPYHNYGPHDLLTDEYFQRWVAQPNRESNAFWTTWLLNHPEKREEVEEARRLLRELHFREDLPSEAARQRVWQQITAANAALDEEKPGQPEVEDSGFSYRYWRGIAATLVGAVALVGLLLFYLNRPQDYLYQTGFAEVKSLVLPDGSRVMLNANSSLRVSDRWPAGQPREVWLSGEAFFSVAHTPDHQKFLVHASEAVSVEVLGTEFNVYGREKGTRVVLTSGKVQLNIQEAGATQQVLMQPGELVEVVKEANTYTRTQKQVNPEKFTAWTERRIVFDNTPVEEMVTVLEDTYGLEITVEDPSLLQKRLWGSVPLGDAGEVLIGLEKTFNWKVTRNGSKVRIEE
ncbi:hypothetical protein BH24BAC1_BH24BAC1_06660 [soil metagenome]